MNQPTEEINEPTNEDTVDFVPLKDFEDDYEILNQHPFTIRKKSNNYIIREYLHHSGYIALCLFGKVYYKHVLIAKQFIPNDDTEHKTQIDHKNQDRSDYHLDNLRWVSPSENQKNKSSNRGIVYEYVDKISDDAVVVNDYGNHQFENYYYYDDIFYFYNGIRYRKLHINMNKRSGSLFVNMMDTNNKKVNIFYSTFKRLYDII